MFGPRTKSWCRPDTTRDSSLPDSGCWLKGYAFEAAAAVKAYGKDVLGISRLVAITNPDNESSIRLLEKIGLRFEGMIRLSEDSSEVRLFASEI